jgi:hypothetical protein
MLADESHCYVYYRNARKGVYPELRKFNSIEDLSSEIAQSASQHQPLPVILIMMGRESTETEVGEEVVNYIQTKGTKIYERKYLVLDDEYRRIKSRITGRDTYDAKLTLLKYELP